MPFTNLSSFSLLLIDRAFGKTEVDYMEKYVSGACKFAGAAMSAAIIQGRHEG